MSTVIKVQNLSKKYSLGEVHSDLLSERMGTGLRSFYRKVLGKGSSLLESNTSNLKPDKDFWALSDVSFEVKQGEVVGIIGRNGAGKSTLLKILSKITPPTLGRVEMVGRVASLLEVGTGFHPELTGRENIFLNGAILGMSKAEIKKKFDEIVAFAEVEKFVDTPVKHYSSGMYVRLAFAVAAHLEPEILIVDEVLAVGDAQFQKKCLGKMGEVAKEGRTVLFVSHNLDAVSRICSSAIFLREGSIVLRGKVLDAIRCYTEHSQHYAEGSNLSSRLERWGTGRFKILGLEIREVNGIQVNSLQSGKDYEFDIAYAGSNVGQEVSMGVVSLSFADMRGVVVILVSSDFHGAKVRLDRQHGNIVCRIRDLNLAAGDYTITLFLGGSNGEVFDCLNDVVRITVAGGDFFGTGHPGLPDHCRILTRSDWLANP